MSDICAAFRSNPSVNPRTGRSIKIGGPTYNALMKECGMIATPLPVSITQSIASSSGPSKPIPPKLISSTKIDEEIKPITVSPPIEPDNKRDVLFKLEEVVESVDTRNVYTYMEEYDMILPPSRSRDVVAYFKEEISRYEPILTRDPYILPPPILQNNTSQDALEILAPYTTRELLEAYEPDSDQWKNYRDLVYTIVLEGKGTPKWSWRHKHCNNDTNINTLEFIPRNEINKDDPNNPTLSYGIQHNYRCYQVHELEGTFREEDGVFIFGDPDYSYHHPVIDPLTGEYLTPEFPLVSIVQLNDLLSKAPREYNIKSLHDKIKRGINLLRQGNIYINKLKRQYNEFPESIKDLLNLFLVWLFLFGLWMRFWKGPGYQWPGGGYKESPNVKKDEEKFEEAFEAGFEDDFEEEFEENDICTPGERDENVLLYREVGEEIIDSLRQYPNIINWIDTIDNLKYDYKNKQIIRKIGTIMNFIKGLSTGGSCLAVGGDLITQSAYSLLMIFLNLQTYKDLIDVISEYLPRIYNIERSIVDRMLPSMREIIARTDNPTYEQLDRLQVLEDRYTALHQPIPILTPFNNEIFQPTAHL